MGRKPGGDLGAMTLTKAQAAETVPFKPAAPLTAPQPMAAPSLGAAKSLTVKLDAETYASLRAYCYAQEQARGTRLTHQDVVKQALVAFLAANTGA